VYSPVCFSLQPVLGGAAPSTVLERIANLFEPTEISIYPNDSVRTVVSWLLSAHKVVQEVKIV